MTLSSKFFGTLCIEVGETHFVGDTPGGRRRT